MPRVVEAGARSAAGAVGDTATEAATEAPADAAADDPSPTESTTVPDDEGLTCLASARLRSRKPVACEVVTL